MPRVMYTFEPEVRELQRYEDHSVELAVNRIVLHPPGDVLEIIYQLTPALRVKLEQFKRIQSKVQETEKAPR